MRPSRFWLIVKSAALVVFVLGLASEARAQGFGGGMPGGFGGMPMGPGAPTRSAPKKKEQPPGTPELHAASGGSETTLPQGSEPTLPEEPLKLTDPLKARLGSDFGLDEPTLGRDPGAIDRDFYGLYYQEHSDRYRLRLAFPVWMERTQPSLTDSSKDDRASVFGGVYYNRRSAEHADDILFPVFWNLRDTDSRTTILGPFVNREAKDTSDNWLAPLYFFGTRPNGSYQIIPPLLTYLNQDNKGGFDLIGPAFCSFSNQHTADEEPKGKGGGCFGNPVERDLGIAPFYFGGHDPKGSYRLIPPLLHYHSDNPDEQHSLNIWGPFYRESTEERELFHVLPFYWSIWGADEHHTTLFPFFHYGWRRNASLFVNPLWLDATTEEGNHTFATWGYASYRGRTELDMFTPLLWLYRDPDAGVNQQLLFPFFYHRTGPRENSIALFPFYGSFHRYGVSDQTWITPLFEYEHSLTGWKTNLMPIAFFGRDRHDSHSVIAPIFWDFSTPSSRTTIVAPIYWRFARPNAVTQIVGNFVYTEKKVAHGLDWKFHILPGISYGETPDGHSWDLLFGLVGYVRRGEYTALKLFWSPITLSGHAPE
ncbi:MAG TPA: hypothetical protein VHM70_11955 [Polyangiaceae bacterium]|nr:hypothetical protein [Polyangiaceae bacterium]